jgi:hypothetical protein
MSFSMKPVDVNVNTNIASQETTALALGGGTANAVGIQALSNQSTQEMLTDLSSVNVNKFFIL